MWLFDLSILNSHTYVTHLFKTFIFQLLKRILSKRSLASVILPLATIKKAKLIIKIKAIEMIKAIHRLARLKYVIKPNNTPAKENKTAKK